MSQIANSGSPSPDPHDQSPAAPGAGHIELAKRCMKLLAWVESLRKNLKKRKESAVPFMGAQGELAAVSIFGPRGSGKTSLLLLLRQCLQEAIRGDRDDDLETISDLAAREKLDPNKQRSGSDVVLPLIVPYGLGGQHSVMAVVLNALKCELEKLRDLHCPEKSTRIERSTICDDDWRETRERPPPKFLDLEQELDKITRDYPASTSTFVESLREGTSGLDDLSWQWQQSIQRSGSLPCRFQKWLSEYFAFRAQLQKTIGSGANRHDLLIIPIDDYDLRPEIGGRVLEDIVRFFFGPHIVVIIGAELYLTEQAIGRSVLKPYENVRDALKAAGVWEDEKVDVEIASICQKLFPVATRSELPGVDDLAARLNYRPLFEPDAESIWELLGRLNFNEDMPHPTTKMPLCSFRVLFDLGTTLKFKSETSADGNLTSILPSQFCHALPRTYRGLNQLHQFLHGKADDLTDLPRGQAALNPEQIAEILLKIGQAFWGSLAGASREMMRDRILWRSDNSVDLDLQGIRQAVLAGQGRSLSVGDVDISLPPAPSGCPPPQHEIGRVSRRVRLTKLENLNAWQETGDDRKDARQRRGSAMNAGVMSMLALVREFRGKDWRVQVSAFGDLSTPGGSAWDGVCQIEVFGRKTHNLFFYMPDFDNFLPYYQYIAIWNSWIDGLMAVPAEELLGNEQPTLDFFALGHLLAILQIELEETFQPISFPKAGDDKFATILTKAHNSIKEELEILLPRLKEYAARESQENPRTGLQHGAFIKHFLHSLIAVNTPLCLSGGATVAINGILKNWWTTLGIPCPGPITSPLRNQIREQVFKSVLSRATGSPRGREWKAAVMTAACGAYDRLFKEGKIILLNEAEEQAENNRAADMKKIANLRKKRRLQKKDKDDLTRLENDLRVANKDGRVLYRAVYDEWLREPSAKDLGRPDVLDRLVRDDVISAIDAHVIESRGITPEIEIKLRGKGIPSNAIDVLKKEFPGKAQQD